jgi:hypothetical protein
MTAVVAPHDTAPPRTVLHSDPPLEPPESGREPAPLSAVLSRILVTITLLVAWALSYLFVLSSLEQAHAQKGLYARLRTELAQGIAPTAAPIAGGAPVALLDVPGASIHRLVVVEGTSAEQLQDGPGHLRNTVLPGQPGTSVLLGRALTFGAPFGELTGLQRGAPITVTTGQGRFTYHVLDVRRRGAPVPAAPGAAASRLVLVTAAGSGWLGPLAPARTVYVDADLAGPTRPAGTVPPGIGSHDSALSADPSTTTMLELVLALQLFVGVLVAVTWARTRWSASGAWLAGTPLVLASLWLLSSISARLLPNLM